VAVRTGLVLATNTMHKLAAGSKGRGLPLLHIADATGAALRAAGVQRAGAAGHALHDGRRSIVQDRLAQGFGLQVRGAGDDDRAEVHRVIYDELCRGVGASTSRRPRGAIDRLAQQGAQA
jgi:aspartate racemase